MTSEKGVSRPAGGKTADLDSKVGRTIFCPFLGTQIAPFSTPFLGPPARNLLFTPAVGDDGVSSPRPREVKWVRQDERTWFQRRQLLEAGDFRQRQVVELVDGGADAATGGAGERRVEDGSLVKRRSFAHAELGTDVVLVRQELAARLVEDVEQGMPVEVDPDQRAGDAALVARVRPNIRGAHGVDGCLLAGDAVGHRLEELLW